MSINKVSNLLIVLIAIVVVLIYGKSLLIPFVFSLFLWFLVREIRHRLDKLKFIRDKFPSWLKNVVSSAFIFVLLGFVSKVLLSSINSLAGSYAAYESNIEYLVLEVNNLFSIDIRELIKSHSGDLDFGLILSSVLSSISDIFGNAFIIIFYTLFIFLEEANFQNKLKKVFPSATRFNAVTATLEKIEHSITQYIGLKTLVSVLTGTMSFVALKIIGVDSPVFWAFLIFILNFIPTIGSLIGTVFPAIFCLLQFGDFVAGIQVLFIVGIIQVLVGNILEPKIMGNSLNISSLVAIIALSFWGTIWGITGMILSVPITVILVILFAQFEPSRPFAILLSEKGDV